ncbi:hypothetical protein QCA50_006829 [Cerrena zonata]|uniref:tRNA-splicing endonuclease subunit Sen54 N-terminal domain-containing protein n=1 Tax=Cerrena zonata TaxID=2478898 RepID=A0AAW0G9R1_9APHY
MDDDLERPSVSTQPTNDSETREDEDLSSGDEDEGLDWTKLPGVARPVIPKRGEKDYEPIVQGGSGYQQHVLGRARTAMFDALRVPRTISSKGVSYGIWYPDIARVHVTTARGTHFASMGHSVAREDASIKKTLKRLELLPEEALYLVERGSLFCWKTIKPPTLDVSGLDGVEGSPMMVQQVSAEMIGKEDLSSEKYQVYAYLRRLGYVVTRTNPPTPAYPRAAPFEINARVQSLAERIPSVFKSLRVIPSGHSTPLNEKKILTQPPSPYEIFFNVYKPATPFKKTAPPAPDFSIVVVNARTTPIPTLSELTQLFGILPELPPPVPRRRLAFAQQKEQKTNVTIQNNPSPSIASSELSLLQRLIYFIYPARSPIAQVPRPPNPFALLKAGKKLVIIAAVDAGIISFFGFRQGAFEEFPMT